LKKDSGDSKKLSKSKTFLVWLFVFGLVSHLLSAQAAEVKKKETGLRIVTTILPVTIFTLNVVGQTPGVRVEMH
jgi:ABC-type Zn uptake system ZnuABC Zn-binding protein ZnuA